MKNPLFSYIAVFASFEFTDCILPFLGTIDIQSSNRTKKENDENITQPIIVQTAILIIVHLWVRNVEDIAE